jgi:hypothetical protein
MLFCTEGFDRLASLMLHDVSEPLARIVRLPHPLADRTEGEVEHLAEGLLPEVRSWLATLNVHNPGRRP